MTLFRVVPSFVLVPSSSAQPQLTSLRDPFTLQVKTADSRQQPVSRYSLFSNPNRAPTPATPEMWTLRLNAVFGSLVVAVGFWLIWGELPLAWTAALALAAAGFLLWRGRTIGEIWAWSTLLLGFESLAWPIATMIQIRLVTTEPTNEQMGAMLTAILFGLFSSIFWITFSYGLFKRAGTRGGHGGVLSDKPGERRATGPSQSTGTPPS